MNAVVEQAESRVPRPGAAVYMVLALVLLGSAAVAGVSIGAVVRGCRVTPAWAYPWMGGRLFLERLVADGLHVLGCALR